MVWYIASIIQAVTHLIITVTVITVKVRAYRARRDFERLPTDNPTNPYRACVENIPPDEGVPEEQLEEQLLT